MMSDCSFVDAVDARDQPFNQLPQLYLAILDVQQCHWLMSRVVIPIEQSIDLGKL